MHLGRGGVGVQVAVSLMADNRQLAIRCQQRPNFLEAKKGKRKYDNFTSHSSLHRTTAIRAQCFPSIRTNGRV